MIYIGKLNSENQETENLQFRTSKNSETEILYVKNIDGYLQITAMGGSGAYIDITEFELADKDENSYTFNLTGIHIPEGAPERGTQSCKMSFIKQDGKYIISEIGDWISAGDYGLINYVYEDNLVFINSLEMHENDYLLKGSLYRNMTISKDEVNQKLKNQETISIGGKEYTIVEIDGDSTKFRLKTADGESHYYLELLNENDGYEVKSATEFNDVWELFGSVQMPVSKEARIIRDTGERIAIKDYYLANKGVVREEEDSTNPSNVYSHFALKDGKCIEFSEHITGH